VKSLKSLCNAYKRLKREKSDPEYLKFGIDIVEDLYNKLGIGDPCARKRKKRKRPKKPIEDDKPQGPGVNDDPTKGRLVIFDSSPYESTRCMNNTAFNKLEARIITNLRDKNIDRPLMEKVLEVFKLECQELTPVDTGLLVSSLYTYVEFTDDTVIGVIGYDIANVFRISGSGDKVFYALAVHNRMANHNNPPRATWRFLEIAFENEYIRNIAKELLK
jgi:hypothetical protein